MTCQYRLPTKDQISRFGVITDGLCSFCGEQESCTDLFFYCVETKKVWSTLLTWLKINHNPRRWDTELEWIIHETKGKSITSRLLKLATTETVYQILYIRNQRIFQTNVKSEIKSQEIIDMICLRAEMDRKLARYC